MPQEEPPRVFISYSHDSDAHSDRVMALVERLRAGKHQVVIDAEEPFPEYGWPQWCQDQIRDADFVLVICTATYRRRAEGTEAPGVGLGAAIILQYLYEAKGKNRKFIPVVLSKDDADHRPSLTNLAELHRNQGRYPEAEPLYQRALAICEKALGPNHPNTVTCAKNYAARLRKLGRDDEARALEARFNM